MKTNIRALALVALWLLVMASSAAPASARTDGPKDKPARAGFVGTVASNPATISLAQAMKVAVPKMTAKQKQLYRDSLKHGKDLRSFTVVGDCNSQPSVYLRRVSDGEYDASKLNARLQQTVNFFASSFPRVSLAARGGFTTAGVNDPTFADGALCHSAESGETKSPFACELWVSKASVVFIELGTGDQYDWRAFEANYRALVSQALKSGVLPILVTKADALEEAAGAPPDAINNAIRKLAKQHAVPLLDFALAARALPNKGLIDEGDLDFHLSDEGKDLHIFLTLQTLDGIWR